MRRENLIPNKKLRGVLFVAILGVFGFYHYQASGQSPEGGWEDEGATNSNIEVHFSPGGGCESAIVREIENAKNRIGMQAYFFTSREIAKALEDAVKRDIRVTLILDESQRKIKYSPWRQLKKAGINVLFDKEHKTANNKIILIDDHTVLTGSYNYTKAAEDKNAENLLIIRDDKTVFDKFRRNFKTHMDHSH